MSTGYFRLRKPFTCARASVEGTHTHLSLWVNHALSGVLVLRNEELGDALHALRRDNEACRVGSNGLHFDDDDIEAATTLVSDCGELVHGRDIGVTDG